MAENPEIGLRIEANGLGTNYHDRGRGPTVVLVHGSGPGVTAWANWRGAIPALASDFRVLAPDIAGFGYTERKSGVSYDLDFWVHHLLGFLDATGVERASLVGNSFGGALALATALRVPERIDRLVLMGAAGTRFELTPGLDITWGYEPSLDNMRELIRLFAHDQTLATEELVQMRYEASIRPGYQETYASMFPPPRERWIDALASPPESLRGLEHETLILHGRDDRIIPLQASLNLLELIPRSQLHVFGRCGHWTQIEHGARFCELVRRHLLEGETESS